MSSGSRVSSTTTGLPRDLGVAPASTSISRPLPTPDRYPCQRMTRTYPSAGVVEVVRGKQNAERALPKLGGSARGLALFLGKDRPENGNGSGRGHTRSRTRSTDPGSGQPRNAARGPFLEHELLRFRWLHRWTLKDVAARYSSLIPFGTCLSQTIRNDGIDRRVKNQSDVRACN